MSLGFFTHKYCSKNCTTYKNKTKSGPFVAYCDIFLFIYGYFSKINEFLEEIGDKFIDIKYQVSVGVFSEEQIFCFSAMIIYVEN